MTQRTAIDVQFFAPPEDLARYVSTIYRMYVTAPEGEVIADQLIPEWCNLRFTNVSESTTGRYGGEQHSGPSFLVSGPTAHPVEFSTSSGQIWGFGLLPLGWASMVGANASDFADATFDGETHENFAGFTPLGDKLFESGMDDAQQYWALVQFVRAQVKPIRDEARILAVQEALMDPYLVQIPEFADRVDVSIRTLERLCLKSVGFSPNVILRRQRLVRSLASFMADGDTFWSEAIDRHYHDQPHFVREFHYFMGMSPTEYAAMDHPIMSVCMDNRQDVWGRPVRPNSSQV